MRQNNSFRKTDAAVAYDVLTFCEIAVNYNSSSIWIVVELSFIRLMPYVFHKTWQWQAETDQLKWLISLVMQSFELMKKSEETAYDLVIRKSKFST